MDSILTTIDILQETTWLFFKLYKDPSTNQDWKSNLDWYHKVLINIVKPTVENTPAIRVVFFGLYGPRRRDPENEEYERQILPPNADTCYIRLRLSVVTNDKNAVKNTLETNINANRNMVWDYEIMTTYHVRDDLGNRYGSRNDDQTLRFIRYWDSACRYILSILTLPGNWISDVDVWGIPHLVNNSLGASLRLPNAPCPSCHVSQYLETGVIASSSLPFNLQATLSNFQSVPIFVVHCPICGRPRLASTNI